MSVDFEDEDPDARGSEEKLILLIGIVKQIAGDWNGT